MLELAIMPFVAVALPAYFTKAFVRMGLSRSPLIREAESTLDPEDFPQEWRDFIAEHRMSSVGSFQYQSMPFTVFQHMPEKEVFRALVVRTEGGRRSVNFVTQFGKGSSLTTSGGSRLGMFPRCDGSYSQGFPNAPLGALFRRHLEGESFLLNTRKVRIGPLTGSLRERLERDVRAQAQLVSKMPLYWLRAIHWFWVRRFRVANKTVEQLTQAAA